jgi:serine/threonine protein phosphatase PrpC
MAIRKTTSDFLSSAAAPPLISGSATRTGRRAFNEDAVFTSPLFSDRPGRDCIFAVADGLYNNLSTQEITYILTQPRHAAGMAEALVNEAVNAGAGDNITALVVHHDSNRHPK